MGYPSEDIEFVHSIGFGDEAPKAGGEGEPSYDYNHVGDAIGLITNSIADTSASEDRTRNLLKLMYPGAIYRRVMLPVAHHPSFMTRAEEYNEVIEEETQFCKTSTELQAMLEDHGRFSVDH